MWIKNFWQFIDKIWIKKNKNRSQILFFTKRKKNWKKNFLKKSIEYMNEYIGRMNI